MTTYLSKYNRFPIKERPSLCGYCLRGGRGFYYINSNNKIWTACSYEHLEKIKRRLEMKENINIKISCNPTSVDKAISQVKAKYIETSRKNNSFAMHEWDMEDKKKFFELFTAYYLSAEEIIADVGL